MTAALPAVAKLKVSAPAKNAALVIMCGAPCICKPIGITTHNSEDTSIGTRKNQSASKRGEIADGSTIRMDVDRNMHWGDGLATALLHLVTSASSRQSRLQASVELCHSHALLALLYSDDRAPPGDRPHFGSGLLSCLSMLGKEERGNAQKQQANADRLNQFRVVEHNGTNATDFHVLGTEDISKQIMRTGTCSKPIRAWPGDEKQSHQSAARSCEQLPF
ncbi:MAG TPA: hypothetical protein VH678_16705 [Xanthobacteraceae bacterium]